MSCAFLRNDFGDLFRALGLMVIYVLRRGPAGGVESRSVMYTMTVVLHTKAPWGLVLNDVLRRGPADVLLVRSCVGHR
jgi:hypothetical protein